MAFIALAAAQEKKTEKRDIGWHGLGYGGLGYPLGGWGAPLNSLPYSHGLPLGYPGLGYPGPLGYPGIHSGIHAPLLRPAPHLPYADPLYGLGPYLP